MGVFTIHIQLGLLLGDEDGQTVLHQQVHHSDGRGNVRSLEQQQHVLPRVLHGPGTAAGQGCDCLLPDGRQFGLHGDHYELLQQGEESGTLLGGDDGVLQGGHLQSQTLKCEGWIVQSQAFVTEIQLLQLVCAQLCRRREGELLPWQQTAVPPARSAPPPTGPSRQVLIFQILNCKNHVVSNFLLVLLLSRYNLATFRG